MAETSAKIFSGRHADADNADVLLAAAYRGLIRYRRANAAAFETLAAAYADATSAYLRLMEICRGRRAIGRPCRERSADAGRESAGARAASLSGTGCGKTWQPRRGDPGLSGACCSSIRPTWPKRTFGWPRLLRDAGKRDAMPSATCALLASGRGAAIPGGTQAAARTRENDESGRRRYDHRKTIPQ